MRIPRSLAVLVLGAVLMAGCGSGADEPREASAVDSPSTSSATSSTDRPTATTTVAATPEESDTEDPVSISLFDADFAVDGSGRMRVIETLTLDVPVDDRHGIFRYFEDAGAVEGFLATLDGSQTPIEEDAVDGQVTYRIGDPDRTLGVGEHVVAMTYEVPDVLLPAGDAWFDWQLVQYGWDLDIDASALTVTMPEPVSDAECFVGRRPCDVAGLRSDTLTITTDEVDDSAGVRLRVFRP